MVQLPTKAFSFMRKHHFSFQQKHLSLLLLVPVDDNDVLLDINVQWLKCGPALCKLDNTHKCLFIKVWLHLEQKKKSIKFTVKPQYTQCILLNYFNTDILAIIKFLWSAGFSLFCKCTLGVHLKNTTNQFNRRTPSAKHPHIHLLHRDL